MPLFNRKRFTPRFTRFLYRKLENPDTPPDQKAAIEKVLDDPKKLGIAATRAHALAKKGGLFDKPEFVAAMAAGAEGDHPILEAIMAFLAEHWDEILAILLKLLGL